MIGIHTAETIRDAEATHFEAHPEANLMRLAAAAVAERAAEMAPEGTILVVVGPGNNGGDGLYAARNLSLQGRLVTAWLVDGTAHPGGVVAARQSQIRFVDSVTVLRMLPEMSLVIDAYAGIGGRTGLPRALAQFAEAVQMLAIPVLAVDLPSGLAADSHERPDTFIQARHTITFGAPKMCTVAQPAASCCGDLEIVDLGFELPESQINQMQRVDVARWWPWPTTFSDKYSRGVLGVDTGSNRYPGAAVLSVTGALYSGAGMLRFVGPDRPAGAVLNAQPSVTMGHGRVQAWLAGCGWGPEASAERLAPLLDEALPTIVDAEALAYLPDELPEGWLLTPHAGELAAMLEVERDEVVADPIGHARAAASRWQATVLLKGSTQYVAEPSGRITLAIAGPAWTAQAGSGDVLAGICGTLLAAGLPAWKAGALGASVQALAAARKSGPFPPEVVAQALPKVLDELGKVVEDQAIRAGDLAPSSIAVS